MNNVFMRNRVMEQSLDRGLCLDVRAIGEDIGNGWYELREFHDGKDYCDAIQERWIWSIGRRKSDGKIIASLGSDMYCNEEYECIWLR